MRRMIPMLCVVAAVAALPHDGATQAPKKAYATKFASPLKGEWKPDSKFGAEIEGKTLLGEGKFLEAGTKVYAAAKGRLVYPKTDEQVPEHVAILAHWLTDRTAVFTVYRHVTLREGLKYGAILELGDELGALAPGKTVFVFQINLDPHDKFRGKEAFGLYAGGEPPHRLKDNIAPTVVLGEKNQVELLLKEEASADRK